MRSQAATSKTQVSSLSRIRLWYALLLVLAGICVVRLFYLQVIKYSYYQTTALTTQLKEYEVPATRGVIEVQADDSSVPIVLNEIKYTLYADPVYVEDAKAASEAIAGVIGGSADEYKLQLLRDDSRYVVLAKKLDKTKAEELDKLSFKGIGTREATYRTYPQGNIAAQLLGFVNDEGKGAYGIEEALNDQLGGKPGQLKAITDAQGVPLASNKDNVITEAQAGDRLLLTVDLGMQQRLEEILQQGLKNSKSESGSALILDVKTGAVKAMANYPTYNPAEFFNVEDATVFNNATVSAPLEVGSIMKTLTMAAALDQGVVNQNTTYYDPGVWQIDDARIVNVEGAGGSGTRSMGDILQRSLNTGATWLLKQMGGGEINKQARERWHGYMTEKYGLGEPTGIEQGYEASGSIPDPNDGFGLDIQYANTAFGQGMTATILQMAAALSSAVNGGTYYQPRLVEKVTKFDGTEDTIEPKVVRANNISTSASAGLRNLMEYAFSRNFHVYGRKQLRPEYAIGGKTGTAQIPKPGGGYYDDRYNGTFMGFVGGDEAEYVVISRVSEPKIGGYAGSVAAGPIFVQLVESLINNGKVTPKGQ